MQPVSININGRKVTSDVEPRTLLIHFIRERAGLTGTHIGCDTSQCGACTVLLDGQAVKSCTILAVQVEGQSIQTIEGISDGEQLHPMQVAFLENFGLQCGYCTPGFVMAALQILNRYPSASDDEIRHQLKGNICRCTGYQAIIQSILSGLEKVRVASAPKSSAGQERI